MPHLTLRPARIGAEMARVLGPYGYRGEAGIARRLPLDKLLLTDATLHNTVTYHESADESREALLSAIWNAKRSFHIETFIWRADTSGMEVANALIAKVHEARVQGRPFDAKVLVDSIGLVGGPTGHDGDMIDYLNANGVEARIFNRHKFSLRQMGVPLTHRKLYIADAERYLIGGRNIGDEYLQPTYRLDVRDPASEMNSQHDFLMTVRGEEAARVEREFFENWARAGGKVPDRLPRPVPAPDGHTAIQTFTTDPVAHEYGIRDVHLRAIASARKDVLLITPYLGDRQLLDALAQAKTKNTETRSQLLARATNEEERRAVNALVPELQIRVLVPRTGEANKRDINYEMEMMSARKLLKAGVQVRITSGGQDHGTPVQRFSHFKALMVDHEVLSVGSANADHRTYHDNHEVVNLVADPKKVEEFHRTIARSDWETAQPIDRTWIKTHSSWWERAFRRVASWLSFLY